MTSNTSRSLKKVGEYDDLHNDLSQIMEEHNHAVEIFRVKNFRGFGQPRKFSYNENFQIYGSFWCTQKHNEVDNL